MDWAKPANSANAGVSTRSVAPSVLPRMVRNTKDGFLEPDHSPPVVPSPHLHRGGAQRPAWKPRLAFPFPPIWLPCPPILRHPIPKNPAPDYSKATPRHEGLHRTMFGVPAFHKCTLTGWSRPTPPFYRRSNVEKHGNALSPNSRVVFCPLPCTLDQRMHVHTATCTY
jgi:hypothetical protein